jgi:hypothetical protein
LRQHGDSLAWSTLPTMALAEGMPKDGCTSKSPVMSCWTSTRTHQEAGCDVGLQPQARPHPHRQQRCLQVVELLVPHHPAVVHLRPWTPLAGDIRPACCMPRELMQHKHALKSLHDTRHRQKIVAKVTSHASLDSPS